MLKQLLCFSLPLLLLACDSKQQKQAMAKPTHFIEQEEMKTILIEMHLIDTYSENANLGRAKIPAFSKLYYEKTLKKYGLTQEQFDSNFNYYHYYPALFKSLYDDVLDDINKKEAEFR